MLVARHPSLVAKHWLPSCCTCSWQYWTDNVKSHMLVIRHFSLVAKCQLPSWCTCSWQYRRDNVKSHMFVTRCLSLVAKHQLPSCCTCSWQYQRDYVKLQMLVTRHLSLHHLHSEQLSGWRLRPGYLTAQTTRGSLWPPGSLAQCSDLLLLAARHLQLTHTTMHQVISLQVPTRCRLGVIWHTKLEH